MGRKAIFIAATGQNVGKTTISLSLIQTLRKTFPRLGVIKPVGQQHEKVGSNLLVDKDVVLFKETFSLKTPYEEMSPVIFPSGFTRDFLDGKIDEKKLLNKIEHSFKKISSESDFTLVEGTGHMGVGSIVNLSNAVVAKRLGLDVVIIAKGGLGSSFDELALSKALCDREGVHICGVILNKVLPEKKEMVTAYMQKALSRFKIPLLGVIPYSPFLNAPVMVDFETLFDTTLLSGQEYRYRHFEEIRLVAAPVETYKEWIRSDELIVTSATRDDIVEALIERQSHFNCPSNGVILTGRHPPLKKLIEKLKKAHVPALYCPHSNFEVMQKITSFSSKIRKGDVLKVERAIDLVGKFLDVSQLYA